MACSYCSTRSPGKTGGCPPLPPPAPRNSDHQPARVEAACRRSLQDLRLSYLDLYLVHWPVTGSVGPELQPPLADTWAAMERLVAAGLARAIGVSNLSAAKLGALLERCSVRPAVNQVRADPGGRGSRRWGWGWVPPADAP
jgi:alcohol dehydrogenase (NADP+)